ncbi:MAG: PilZ domain-containing protein [Planctomycetota bacterium]
MESSSNLREEPRQKQIFYQGRIRKDDGDTLGKVWDLSLGGLRLVTEHEAEVGSAQTISIELPSESQNEISVQLKATCVWSRASELPGYHDSGFVFTGLTEDQVRLLEALMAVSSF